MPVYGSPDLKPCPWEQSPAPQDAHPWVCGTTVSGFRVWQQTSRQSFPKASCLTSNSTLLFDLREQRRQGRGHGGLEPTLSNAREVFTAFPCSLFQGSISWDLVKTSQGFGYQLALYPDQCGLTLSLDQLNHDSIDVIFLEDIACWIRNGDWVTAALN